MLDDEGNPLPARMTRVRWVMGKDQEDARLFKSKQLPDEWFHTSLNYPGPTESRDRMPDEMAKAGYKLRRATR